MNDPLLNKLARFSPNDGGVSANDILFAAGRASARTHIGWKLVVGGLLVANAVSLSLLLFGTNANQHPANEPAPPAIQTPPKEEPTTTPQPVDVPQSEDPWSYKSLHLLADPEQLPPSQLGAKEPPSDKPLTVRSTLRSEID
jgi:hypothetical protein